MDFRIIELDGQQVLLERIEDDGQWVVVASVYIDTVNRFDEWWEFQADPQGAKSFIENFMQSDIDMFIHRAKAWWDKQNERGPLPWISKVR